MLIVDQNSTQEPSNFIPVDSIGEFPGYLEFDMVKDDVSIEFVVRQVVIEGKPVAVCMGEVYALIADARNTDAIHLTRNVKHRPEEKPFAVLMEAESMCAVADLNKIHPDLHKFFKNPELINNLFGNKGFLRFPVKQNVGLDATMIGPGHKLQAFTFDGDPVAYKFEKTLRERLKDKHPDGRGEILITSYNISGKPSITKRKDANNLSATSKLFVQVNRETSGGGGSYSIYDFDLEGVRKVRHGSGADMIDQTLEVI